MAKPTAPGLLPSTSNRILRLLHAGDRAQLEEMGRRSSVTQGDVLQETGEPIEKIYFPLSGVLSLMAVLSTGQSAEVASIGREGFAGLPVFLGAKIASTQTLVQVAGECIELDANHFRKEMSSGGRLAIILARYAELLFLSAAQSTACGRLHTVEERLARAILTWHDRLDRETLPVTQDSLAEALGVRRASVTVAMRTFVDSGAIRRGRGRIYLTDRKKLEGHSCECYSTIQEAFDREVG
ncbi:MAG: Crp/Fnr family transcriptional regulator [bacterium]